MKFLTVSDVVLPSLYNKNIRSVINTDIDAILSCGDLPFYYLDFISTMLNAPLYYVLGNHDTAYCNNTPKFSYNYNRYNYYSSFNSPLYMANAGDINSVGGINLDNKIINFNGLLIGGIEGSIRYNSNILQYTNKQMNVKLFKMKPKLLFNKLFRGRAIDLLITHSPPFGIHDQNDPCHIGFKGFLKFMDRYKPKYLIHGHIHLYDNKESIKDIYKDTIILNTYGYQIIEL